MTAALLVPKLAKTKFDHLLGVTTQAPTPLFESERPERRSMRETLQTRGFRGPRSQILVRPARALRLNSFLWSMVAMTLDAAFMTAFR